MRFRISELQEVLCAAGRPRSGRKHELLGRALSLLRQSEGTSLRERVKNRIVELHRLRFPIRQYQAVDIPQNNGPTLIQPRKTTSDLLDSSNSLQKRGSHEKQSSLASLLQHEDSSSIYDKYTTQKAHIPTTLETLIRPQKGQPNCVSSSEQSLQLNGSSCHDGMPVHPDVRFISLPFAELQDVLIKATSLGKLCSIYCVSNLRQFFSNTKIASLTSYFNVWQCLFLLSLEMCFDKTSSIPFF